MQGMGRRKFRLAVHRKNEYRKARECTVTVRQLSVQSVSSFVQQCPSNPLTSESADQLLLHPSNSQSSLSELKVSISVQLLLECDVSTVNKLQDRIKTLSALPYGNQIIII